MIKLIATDIDGTLLKDGTLMIDPEYMTVIEKLTSKGIIFVACSGRQFISERKLFAPVCDKLLYITDGGTVVRTPHKILKVHTLPEDVWHGNLECVKRFAMNYRTVIILLPLRIIVWQKMPEAACSVGLPILTDMISVRYRTC